MGIDRIGVTATLFAVCSILATGLAAQNTPPGSTSSIPTAAVAQQRLPRSTPEAEGVSSQGVEAFLDAVRQSGLEVHSFMLLRHGKVVAEGWWQPYSPELRHVMFSASKSVTSLGIGIAVDEGRLKLADPVLSFFPEYAADDSISPAMRRLTVRHLLTMSVGQPREAMRGADDWARSFLRNPPTHEPGTVFMYNNMASYMLSAIVQKVTGERLFDYLQPRLFEPLGIENITWDYNPQGITVGMIGSRLHSEDLAKLGQLMLQKGNWQGRQLVSRAYAEDAAAFHISTNNDSVPADQAHDGQRGYGYQFWRGNHNSFRMDGMGGQLSVVLPDHDAVVVFTSNLRVVPDQLALVGEHLVPALRNAPLPPDPAATARLNQRLAALQIPASGNAGNISLPAGVAGMRFVLEENRQGVQAVRFAVRGDRCLLTLERSDESRTLEFGVGAWRRAQLRATSLAGAAPADGFRRSSNGVGPDTATIAALSCGMRDEHTLELTARFVEDNLGAETWTAEFEAGAAGPAVTITTGAARPGGQAPVLRGRAAPQD